jgi:hypothetical protein
VLLFIVIKRRRRNGKEPGAPRSRGLDESIERTKFNKRSSVAISHSALSLTGSDSSFTTVDFPRLPQSNYAVSVDSHGNMSFQEVPPVPPVQKGATFQISNSS